MTRNEVIAELKKLSTKLGPNKVINQKDVRTVPKLDYYLTFHFRTLGSVLKEANLPSSHLALKMSITNEQLLDYLKELEKTYKRKPTAWDIVHEKEIYKKYSERRFTWRIFKTRFGGLKNALKNLENKSGDRQKKISNIAEDVEKENPEFFQNKSRFFGRAAELHVTAELLYHGFQAANIPVDEGLDILAVKSNKTFYFQVKHKDLENNQHISITKSSFEKRGGGDVYYIFVLLSKKIRNFLIIPFHIVNDWIRVGLADEKDGGYSFLIKKDGNDYKLKELVLNKYLDRWEDIK